MSKLREVRERLGISRLKLSRLTGIDYGALTKIEQGKIYFYPGWKKRIARALGVNEAELE
jgi:transcriptional regulator with XRE-family HTH domain